MVLCICYCNASGSKEGVYFTEDLDQDPEEIVPPGCQLGDVFSIDTDFPTGFPLEYRMEKTH